MQPERTLLAWRRTTLTATGVLLLCCRVLAVHHTAAHAVAAGVAALLVAALCGGMAQRARRYRADPRNSAQASPALLLLIALAIACVGVLAAIG
nr:DUF202 domain-containing protein [Gordonia sp. SID5947]